MLIAKAVSDFLMLYLFCGLIGGSAFVIAGVGKVDAAARGSSVGFHLVILPAAVVFWPLLAAKWVNAVRRGATP